MMEVEKCGESKFVRILEETTFRGLLHIPSFLSILMKSNGYIMEIDVPKCL